MKLAPGTFVIGTASTLPAAESHATFHQNDAACALSLGEAADSGTVTIDTLGDASTPTTRSFELEFGSETVSGQFEALLCDVGRTGPHQDASCR